MCSLRDEMEVEQLEEAEQPYSFLHGYVWIEQPVDRWSVVALAVTYGPTWPRYLVGWSFLD